MVTIFFVLTHTPIMGHPCQSDMCKDTGPVLDWGGSFVRVSHWIRVVDNDW